MGSRTNPCHMQRPVVRAHEARIMTEKEHNELKLRREEHADSAYCLQHGWPECHGETMTIDHPDTWRKMPVNTIDQDDTYHDYEGLG